jgi:hypothetical protein
VVGPHSDRSKVTNSRIEHRTTAENDRTIHEGTLMHHFVTLSGVAALLLAVWAVQLTVLALHVRYAIHHGVNDPATENSEFALLVACVITTLLSAIGGGGAIGASLKAAQWGWAHAILAIGTTASYLLLSYATDWEARTWWDKRKARKTGRPAEAVETTA